MSVRDFLFCVGLSVLFLAGGLADCPVGDLNNDCRVDFDDVRRLAQWWLDDGCAAPDCEADLDGIPGVNGRDYAKLAENWLQRGVLTLAINEFMARNTQTIRDPDDPDGSFDDWIEIYNYGPDAIDIGGFYISDDVYTLGGWRIPGNAPAATTIAPGGFLLIWADNETQQGPLHANFALSAGGEDVALFDSDHHLIDAVSFGPQNPDESFGRLPNGTGPWRVFTSPTPGRPNLADPVKVVINEIMYHPGHAEGAAENIGLEYIELYNAGAAPVDVSGWRFTDGVEYTIPPRFPLAGGGYLVIAADVNEFRTRYPAVGNVVGGWTGHLSNNGERIELSDASGVIIDRVRYADEGDWAVRELGPVDRAHRGWEWSNLHDGGGRSLELINPAMPNEYGGNWSAGDADGGTPGAANSVRRANIAPLIADVAHQPIIPGPNDAVTVTARVIDETSPAAVRLHYRVDRSVYSGDESIYPHYEPNDFNDVPMYDDGAHGDGAAGDGVYGAVIPPYGHGRIVEFFVEAWDAAANVRTWPAPSLIDGTPEQVTNVLYQVDGNYDPAVWFAEDPPTHYIIMTEMERARLEDIVRNHSNTQGPDAQMNATFISVDGSGVTIRYAVSVRNRGHGSRTRWPNNYRVNFNSDRDWKGVRAVNLNSRNTYVQLIGSVLCRQAGLPAARAAAVRVMTNGRNLATSGAEMYGLYVQLEVINGDFAEDRWFDDGEGNVYKGMRDLAPADFNYRGTNPDAYRNSYFKQSNESADDWADLIELCRVVGAASDAEYADEIERVLNADNWLLYLAINAFLDNNETSLANGYGDDYYTYAGLVDTRFVLIPHDLDSILGYLGSIATNGIFRARGLATIDRFMTHPRFIARYYALLRELIDGPFSQEQFGPAVRNALGGLVPETTIAQMENFAAVRRDHIRGLIPSEFTLETTLPQSEGYYYTQNDDIGLSGSADAVATRSVLVNGSPATWDPLNARWSITQQTAGHSTPLVSRGARWRYFDQYTDLGPEWYTAIDDSGWAEGEAELGYGDAANTTIGYIDTNPDTPTIEYNITTYFTHRFQVADASQYAFLSLLIQRDDGAVVYLNGVEIARSNMPEGPVGYNTPAFSNVFGAYETTFYGGNAFAGDDDFTLLDASALRDGENILAVEIHQYTATSPDISFDLELSGFEPGEPTLRLYPGVNRITAQAFDGPNGTGNETQRAHIDVWYDDNDESQLSGVLAGTVVLDAASGPWHVTGDLTVPSGATLVIEPGTTLFFDAGRRLTVQVGGRLLAEGTRFSHIRLTRTPGSSNWGGVLFDRTLEDNRLVYVDHEYGDTQGESTDVTRSRVTIDHMTWAATNTRVLNIDHPSVICTNSVFPSISGTEPVHGDGLSGDEYIIFENCVFGTTTGYNDVIDFTHARRPGPVFQIYDCLFMGGGDDGLDFDSTDAHVEGCIFTGFHGGGGDGTSNAISTGDEGWPSEIYAARNVFIDNDHAFLLKEDSFVHAHNNVVVGSDKAVAVFGEPYRNPPRTPGRGGYFDGNIFHDNAAIFEHYFQEPLPNYGPETVEVHRTILPGELHVFGEGNIDADPLFLDAVADFRLMADSAAVGRGPWGLDMGAFVPAGAAISGEPDGATYRTTATLTVGGPGITHYRYSLNNPAGPWSVETPVALPIQLAGLIHGQSYTVYALGKNSAGRWQQTPTASRTWTVDTSYSRLVLNEILAHTHGDDPDIIELYYDGPAAINLTGYSLSDDPADPRKFVISAATVTSAGLSPGGYMVFYADVNAHLKDHTGFALAAEGETLYLYNPAGNLVDSVAFGLQINNYSIGRVGYGRPWRLCTPTFGGANIPAPLGDRRMLKINEWLASGQVLFEDDFIELYNPHPAPVALGGLYLTDNPLAQPDKHRIATLSFIPPAGYAVLLADGTNRPGSVNFRLSADGEMLALLDEDLRLVDRVMFRPQTTDISQGRAPNGGPLYEFFELPTPGVANYHVSEEITTTLLAPENADKRVLVPTADIGTDWRWDGLFDDSTWQACTGSPGGVGYERSSGYQSYITCDVSAMYGATESCYIRIPFTVSGDLEAMTQLTLRVRYDDGFVAWINGDRVASRNFAAETVLWNDNADTSHSDAAAVIFEDIDISDHIGSLRAGANLLAIQGLNYGLTSSDFLISVELVAAAVTPGGEFPYAEDVKVLRGLRVTEIMYHAPAGSQYDYIELRNIGGDTIHIGGVRFVEGIVFEFPAMALDPGDYVVVAANVVAFTAMYGAADNVVGPYTGGLSNSGEELVLTLAWPLDAAVMRFGYADTWHPSTDGDGYSLTIVNPAAHPSTWSDPASWRAALPSPGRP